MTQEDLVNDGWKPELCMIGTLYFKDAYFCKLNEENKVVLFHMSDDIKPLGIAETFEEIDKLRQTHELSEIVHLEFLLNKLKKDYLNKYSEENIVIMTQEEKAKAYDEALERAKNLYPVLHKGCKEVIEDIFPKLAETDGGRMGNSPKSNTNPLYWKPSKAQMIALSLAIDGRCPPTNYYFQDLKDLYNKLLYFY